jgi:hypothetical protein
VLPQLRNLKFSKITRILPRSLSMFSIVAFIPAITCILLDETNDFSKTLSEYSQLPLLYLQTGTGTFLIALPIKGLNLVPAQSYLWITGSLRDSGL